MGKRIERVVTARLFAALLGLLWSVQMAAAACNPDEIQLRGDWGQARFTVELADDADERATGLMHRESMARSAGMLFVYDAPAELTFWMRNTLIELDMIFADELGRVTHIHSRAQPLDETLIPSNGPALVVLEINGGLAEAMGLDVGSEMRHPAFDQSRAAWPCAR